MKTDKNIVILDAEVYINILEDLEYLSKLMDDMIVDMHNVKGGQQVRHSYMLYRKHIWDIQGQLRKKISDDNIQE